MSSKLRESLQIVLSDFSKRNLRDSSEAFLSTLGYTSQRTLPFESLPELLEALPALGADLEKIKFEQDIVQLYGLFQLTADEVRTSGQTQMFSAGQYQNTNVNSYLFFALELSAKDYTRSQLADLTRVLNRRFGIPVFLLLQYDNKLSLSVTRRRINKREADKDVLEKISIIKDIVLDNPNPAHLHILEELHLPALMQQKLITRFAELEEAWNKVLDIETLNKRFYSELANWFYWAASSSEISFPDEKKENKAKIRSTHLIRLITRLIFVWFLKEKNLVPQDLFEPRKLERLLKNFATDSGSNYYQSILQNLFFATLNTEMGLDESGKPNRRFKSDTPTRGNTGYMVHNLYRYQSSFTDPQAALRIFDTVPFLNGGLFECLDREADQETGEKEQRTDGFSDNEKKRAIIPNHYFFSPEHAVDLSAFFGGKAKKAKVSGLLEVLNAYKFTVTENTPIEEEVALDPELLGKVFENLLAAYNPETEETARKQTGSFYTPREIVDFMVDESLIAHLHRALTGGQPVVAGVSAGEQAAMLMPENDPSLLLTPNIQAGDTDPLEQKLRRLFSYDSSYTKEFSSTDTQKLISAIENIKVLDPACGSGAFPMGVLQKLVFVLGRLDPDNQRWLEARKAKLEQEIAKDPEIKTIKKDLETIKSIRLQSIRDTAEREAVQKLQERLGSLEESFNQEIADPDYARKLYLIEDCIYGVDIQPIAIQIAKLRCFIALVVEQRTSPHLPNKGIRPLPNLETKFVAANSLLDLSVQETLAEKDPEVVRLKAELENVRHQHFRARNFRQKKALRTQDKTIRKEVKGILLKSGWLEKDASGMAAFDPYDQNSCADFFSPEWMFGFKQFNLVLGNPPYVRHEKIKDQKEQLKNAFASVYVGTADLYVYFFKRALDLLESGGILSYICSNKFFKSQYGEKLREYLPKTAELDLIVDFSEITVFEAIVATAVIQMQKHTGKQNNQIGALMWSDKDEIKDIARVFNANRYAITQKSLKAEGWTIGSNEKQKLVSVLSQAGKPLGEFIQERFYRGILTGFNEAFVVDKATKESLIKQHPSSTEVLKPFLRGRDVKRWKIENPELWLIFTRRGIDIKKYPAIKKHLEQFRTQLEPGTSEGRKAGSYQWYEIQDNIAYWKEFEESKIMYQELAVHQAFAWDEENFYANNKTFIIPSASKYLLAVLNSKIAWFLFFHFVQHKENGGFNMQSIYLEKVPIPTASSQVSDLITSLVNHILFASKHSALAGVVAYFEQLIDALVYELYLPEVLHGAGRFPFKVIGADLPPLEGTVAGLEGYYRRVYDPNHEIRKLVYRLSDIPEIAIIEGKK
jgi:adenine-specific DNA-methyltransferase